MEYEPRMVQNAVPVQPTLLLQGTCFVKISVSKIVEASTQRKNVFWFQYLKSGWLTCMLICLNNLEICFLI